MSYADDFNNELHSIESRFAGGLSNTSTRKFDNLIKIVADFTQLEEERIYITAATSRASNLWNRLAQGKPLTQHFSFALGIIDAEDLQGGISPASRFIGSGVGHYDAIALAVRRADKWVIGAVLDSDQLLIYDRIAAAFPDVEIAHEVQNIPLDNSELSYAWYVGTTGNNADGQWTDFSDEYIDSGVWVNGWDDKFIDVVKSIAVGDRIAIKSTFTQKKNLPFDNHGKTVGAMRIKAIGTVTENVGDGKTIKVDWTRLDPFKTWFGPGVLREAIHRVDAEEGYVKKQLLAFTFGDEEQDYSLCEEKYQDDIDQPEGADEVAPDGDEETTPANGGINKIYYGAPGCGKSRFVADMLEDAKVAKENIVRVTFHPEYSNVDFIGQILPTIEKNEEGKDIVRYIFNPGSFSLALLKAYSTTDMVYLVIEEINRGNAAAIFGDMFQLLDRVRDTESSDYSASEYPVSNPNLQKYLIGEVKKESIKERLKDGVYIPSNLTIFATMNSSDQNVFTLDTAFKRRWSFEQISNDIERDTKHAYKDWYVPGTDKTWEVFLTKLNDRILDYKIHNQTNEDKRLGKYFVTQECLTEQVQDIADVQGPAMAFAYKVLEYVWNDVCKIGREEWFDTDKYKTLEQLIDAFMVPSAGETPLSVFQNITF